MLIISTLKGKVSPYTHIFYLGPGGGLGPSMAGPPLTELFGEARGDRKWSWGEISYDCFSSRPDQSKPSGGVNSHLAIVPEGVRPVVEHPRGWCSGSCTVHLAGRQLPRNLLDPHPRHRPVASSPRPDSATAACQLQQGAVQWRHVCPPVARI